MAQRAKVKSGPGLEIRLLGEISIVRAGRPVPLPASKKTRALLGYLVATQSQHTRERLCDLLWEGPDDPRAALRWSLAKIRPLLDDQGGARLCADRERVSFEAQGASVDLYTVRAIADVQASRAATTEQLEAAAELLRGELLEGLDLPDCYRYSEWCRAEREAARRLQRSLRSALIERLGDLPERALLHARALCAANPLDESAHISVMELLGKLGRHKDALHQYETCRRILAAESGARPSVELEQARSRLGQHAVAKNAPAPSRPAPPDVQSPRESSAQDAPLVGRSPECATIAEFVRAAADGDSVLLVLGEPGVGKTRLLAELARCVRSQGGLVLSGRAFEAEMIRPYGVWIDALRSHDPMLDGPDPFSVQYGESSDPSADRSRLFETVVARLRRLQVDGRPAAVVIDDIHWIDEASAALIHYATRALEGSSIRIACAARPGELSDNPAARRLVRALTRERRVRQIGVSPLGAADTEELVRPLGARVDAGRVFAESGGNPLFALEVARALLAHGEAVGSLDALLRDRLDQLDGVTREAVSWAAVLGGAFSADVLMRASGLGGSDLVRAADELERRGFIRPSSDGSPGYDFAHDLMRRAAYQAISEPRRRLMHATIARALAAGPEAEGVLAGDVAHHAAMGDDFSLAARASLAAAERCVRLFANGEATELVERGLHHVARLSGVERARLEVGLLRVAVYADAGRKRTAVLEPALRRALLDAQTAGCEAEVTRGLMALSLLHFDQGDFEGATLDSLRTEQLARATTPAQTLHALAHSAQCLALLERELPQAEAMAAEAAQLAAHHGHDVPELSLAQGLMKYRGGEIEVAIALFGRALELAERSGEHWIVALCLTRLAMSELLCGRPSSALGHCAKLREVASRMGESSEGPLGVVLEAVARRDLAEPGAELALAEALEALHALDAQAYLAEALCFATEGDLRAGVTASAEQRVQRALAAAQVSGRVTSIAWVRSLLARIAHARGDLETARAQLDSARALIDAEAQPSGLARARIGEAARLL